LVILEENLCFLFFTQNSHQQCKKAYGEKKTVHFDANAQDVAGRAFLKEKVTNDAGNAEGEIGSAQHEKGYSSAMRHSAKRKKISRGQHCTINQNR